MIRHSQAFCLWGNTITTETDGAILWIIIHRETTDPNFLVLLDDEKKKKRKNIKKLPDASLRCFVATVSCNSQNAVHVV